MTLQGSPEELPALLTGRRGLVFETGETGLGLWPHTWGH